jgi:hypothetical protein
VRNYQGAVVLADGMALRRLAYATEQILCFAGRGSALSEEGCAIPWVSVAVLLASLSTRARQSDWQTNKRHAKACILASQPRVGRTKVQPTTTDM